MKILIRLVVLSGLLGLASWSSAASKDKEKPTGPKTCGVFSTYGWITEGTGANYTFVGGDTGAKDPKVNLWSGGSTGIPDMPPAVEEGDLHGQIGGWVSLSASPSMDWSSYVKGFLKLHLCVPDDQPFAISFKSEDPAVGEWSVRFAKGEEKFGLVRGSEWSQVSIPLREFTNYRAKLTPKNLGSIKDPFVINGSGSFTFTQVYLAGPKKVQEPAQ